MKLYLAPGACSVVPLIALTELGLAHDVERVDFMRGKALANGGKLTDVNERGYVPALRLDDGEVLTEVASLLMYLGDLRPEADVVPKAGTFERVRYVEWLVFTATELHKGLGPLFAKEANEEYKAAAKAKFASRLAVVEKHLASRPFLMGEAFTLADAYVFYAMRAWTRFFKQELTPALAAYYARIKDRSKVAAALEVEGFGA